MKLMKFIFFPIAIVSAFMCAWAVSAQQLGHVGAIPFHMDQADIEADRVTFAQLIEHGDLLFRAIFNKHDGGGRPGSTGTGAARVFGSAPAMIRTSGPDANSCVGCHNQPRVGGAGDFVVNVFVLAQTLDPVTESVSGQFSNERNTLGMFGSGPIEMLAREMTEDLLNIQTGALGQARVTSANVDRKR